MERLGFDFQCPESQNLPMELIASYSTKGLGGGGNYQVGGVFFGMIDPFIVHATHGCMLRLPSSPHKEIQIIFFYSVLRTFLPFVRKFTCPVCTKYNRRMSAYVRSICVFNSTYVYCTPYLSIYIYIHTYEALHTYSSILPPSKNETDLHSNHEREIFFVFFVFFSSSSFSHTPPLFFGGGGRGLFSRVCYCFFSH